MTIRGLISDGCDQLGSLVGERQANPPDAIDIETRVRAIGNDRRKGESSGELDFIFEDAMEVSLWIVKLGHGWGGEWSWSARTKSGWSGRFFILAVWEKDRGGEIEDVVGGFV